MANLHTKRHVKDNAAARLKRANRLFRKAKTVRDPIKAAYLVQLSNAEEVRAQAMYHSQF